MVESGLFILFMAIQLFHHHLLEILSFWNFVKYQLSIYMRVYIWILLY